MNKSIDMFKPLFSDRFLLPLLPVSFMLVVLLFASKVSLADHECYVPNDGRYCVFYLNGDHFNAYYYIIEQALAHEIKPNWTSSGEISNIYELYSVFEKARRSTPPYVRRLGFGSQFSTGTVKIMGIEQQPEQFGYLAYTPSHFILKTQFGIYQLDDFFRKSYEAFHIVQPHVSYPLTQTPVLKESGIQGALLMNNKADPTQSLVNINKYAFPAFQPIDLDDKELTTGNDFPWHNLQPGHVDLPEEIPVDEIPVDKIATTDEDIEPMLLQD